MVNPLGNALSDVSVLDFSTNVAGPYATMVLRDFGAPILKIERRGAGDPSRAMDPKAGASSAVYESLNRGKASLALDLKREEDVATALGLVEEHQVLVESFRPGVMDRLGLGYEAVRRRNPGIIYCSVSGFGYEGMGRDMKAYDPLIQAFAGHLEMTGDKDGQPSRSGASLVDVSAGMWSALGILSALRLPVNERGVHLQVSLLDSIMAFMAHQVAAATATGRDLERLGSDSPLLAPYGAFKASDKPLMIASGNDTHFQQLTSALGTPEIASHPDFTTNAARVANRQELRELLEGGLASRTSEEWIGVLTAAGVPCGPVNTLLEALDDPLVANRGVIGQLDDSVMKYVRNPVRVDLEPIDLTTPAPRLGSHQLSKTATSNTGPKPDKEIP